MKNGLGTSLKMENQFYSIGECKSKWPFGLICSRITFYKEKEEERGGRKAKGRKKEKEKERERRKRKSSYVIHSKQHHLHSSSFDC